MSEFRRRALPRGYELLESERAPGERIAMIQGPDEGQQVPRLIARRTLADIVDVQRQGGRIRVLQHTAGEPLEGLVSRHGGRLPLDVANRLATDLCEGLAALHALGVVHGALAPSSVAVLADGTACIADVGTALLLGTDGRADERYVAPELRGRTTSTEQGDVYSLLAVLGSAVDLDDPAIRRSPLGALVRVALAPGGARPSLDAISESAANQLEDRTEKMSSPASDDEPFTTAMAGVGPGPLLGHADSGADSSLEMTSILSDASLDDAAPHPAPRVVARPGSFAFGLDEFPPGTQVGRFMIERKLGQGGFAQVYLASMRGAHGFEKRVALKRVRPEHARDPLVTAALVDEARVAVELTHPNVVQVLELLEENGELLLAMEFMEGHDLDTVAARFSQARERVPQVAVAWIASEVLAGLHAAHTFQLPSGRPAAIVHRDVTPQNIMLDRKGHVKVIDFGIARAEGRAQLTQEGMIKGKARYLAPELLVPPEDGSAFDHRVDIWSVGIVMWELLAGERLFERGDTDTVFTTILHKPIANLAADGRCDATLWGHVDRALQRDRDARWASASAFGLALRHWVLSRDPGFGPDELARCLGLTTPTAQATR